MARLTQAQAEVIRDLIMARVSPESQVDPYQFWPERNNQDNGRRRAFRSLLKSGLILQPYSLREHGEYRLTRELFDAYNDWWRAEGWRVHQSHPGLP